MGFPKIDGQYWTSTDKTFIEIENGLTNGVGSYKDTHKVRAFYEF
jgi:hypothetical protein